MKLIATLVAYCSIASAAEFYLLALRSASPIHFGQINAAGSGLYIGKPPAVYCPNGAVTTCSNITSTSYIGPSASGGGLYLDDIVPGGQQVYIEPSCGKLQYTLPHSAAMPVDAIPDGWKLDSLPSYDLLSNDHGGIFFCPENNFTDWRMYVDIERVEIETGCLGVDLLAGNATGPIPWEYLG